MVKGDRIFMIVQGESSIVGVVRNGAVQTVISEQRADGEERKQSNRVPCLCASASFAE